MGFLKSKIYQKIMLDNEKELPSLVQLLKSSAAINHMANILGVRNLKIIECKFDSKWCSYRNPYRSEDIKYVEIVYETNDYNEAVLKDYSPLHTFENSIGSRFYHGIEDYIKANWTNKGGSKILRDGSRNSASVYWNGKRLLDFAIEEYNESVDRNNHYMSEAERRRLRYEESNSYLYGDDNGYSND